MCIRDRAPRLQALSSLSSPSNAYACTLATAKNNLLSLTLRKGRVYEEVPKENIDTNNLQEYSKRLQSYYISAQEGYRSKIRNLERKHNNEKELLLIGIEAKKKQLENNNYHINKYTCTENLKELIREKDQLINTMQLKVLFGMIVDIELA
eukprot:TRINITY_DN10922_c0_g1_i1.p1 TRINITY_DN10922_c0_g1~~TRINITY_DN10922_c0_g1_i1.p1  ORF type:complete len:151 (-),score=20.71 TRINITY_DN10922_c0_g1_i1:519-971(-)